MEPEQLETLADTLAGTFPGADDAPLARALLTELASGAAVTPGQLVTASGRPERVVSAALGRWPDVHYDAHGAVVAFSGLSLKPTAHRFGLDGRQLFTWCAWDTLFLPALVNESARVESTCPATGEPITLQIDPEGIRTAEPRDLWVSFPPVDATSTSDIVGSFCCHVHSSPDRSLPNNGSARTQPATSSNSPTPTSSDSAQPSSSATPTTHQQRLIPSHRTPLHHSAPAAPASTTEQPGTRVRQGESLLSH
jgi:alkylmercury lyase